MINRFQALSMYTTLALAGCSLPLGSDGQYSSAGDPNLEPLANDGPTELSGSGRPAAAAPGQGGDDRALGQLRLKPSRAWLDDREAIPAGGGFIYRIKRPVSTRPTFLYQIDPSLGTPDLVTLALTPVEKSGKLNYQQMVAFTDFGSKTFRPGNKVQLTHPGNDVVVQKQGERLEEVTLEPDQKYQLVCTLTRQSWVQEITVAFWTHK